MRLGDGAWAVGDGQSGGSRDGVGQVVHGEGSGVWAVGGVGPDNLSGHVGVFGGHGARGRPVVSVLTIMSEVSIRTVVTMAAVLAPSIVSVVIAMAGPARRWAMFLIGLRDAELSGVLVLTSGVVDQLNTISGILWLEIVLGGPAVCHIVSKLRYY